MSKVLAIIAVSILHFTLTQNVFSQITINLPKLPKIGKQKPEQSKTGQGQDTATTGNGHGQPKNSGDKPIYVAQRPTDTPVLLKNSVYVQAITHNQYWKSPNESNYSSWVPAIRFESFVNHKKTLNYAVEYFNPDGSAWYSEKLEDAGVKQFQSERPNGGVLDTKSTVGTGLYSFKIRDQETNEVIYQGKFKVGKFSTASRPQEKNKFAFFVDHDWLMPFGTVGFREDFDEIGYTEMPVVSVWLKGYGVTAGELEGRLFFQGRQIASTKEIDEKSGRIGGPSDFDERAPEFAASHSPLNYWKRWQFQWESFRFDNDGSGFKRESFKKVHYADKNPGDYVVKIYRNDTQIREMNFSIGPDGRLVVPAYTNHIFMLYHTIVLPVKVIGTSEKWNTTSWKTDALYGNPISGFAAQ
ncbi:MAG: hypothetical protein H7070_07305 [Saprospiraceae bacterium]|nr:hypothetical protein [Pyrinomonadaceae bacterium]